MKKLVSLGLSLCMCAGLLAGCGNDDSTTSKEGEGKSKYAGKEIYFLNFKPEVADKYKAIAKQYEEETGVKVKVETAASGQYETTLTSEIAKKEAPTIFQINGPVGYQTWKDYCADLKDSELYKMLNDQSLAVSVDGGVYGIPYVVEGYGIIYNKEIMDKYFASANKKTDLKSTEEINNFDKLKSVVEDMQSMKDELGIKGVFACTSMKDGEQWRWQTHLANLPMYYEFAEDTNYKNTIEAGVAAKAISFKYGDNFKNTFDLYINNSTCEKGVLGSKSVTDSMGEFALGECAMVQNGNWAWNQVKEVNGYTVKEENIKFLPIYTGVKEEENQGICIGTENFFAINKTVDKDLQAASLEFLKWLFSSDYGKKQVAQELGFIAPFNTFGASDTPNDPLAKEVNAWMTKDGIKTVPWTFAAFPGDAWKNAVGGKLLQYVQGNEDWSAVQKAAIDGWAAEKNK